MNLFLNRVFFEFSSLLFDKKKTKTLILLIVLLFLLLRVPILFTGIEKTFAYEELARGAIARELINGPKFNLIDYQADSYSGGSLVASILTTPFFLLFGQNLFALKLPPLLIFTLMLVLLFKLCDRFFSRKVALISCFIFIFSPPLWTIYSFVNFGFFHESVFFTLLSLFVFYEIFYENKKRLRYFGLFGILCGFSLFFVYFTIFPTISMLFMWFIFDRKFFLKKSFLAFFAGFLIGFSPWIYYGSLNNWPGFEILFNGKGLRSEAFDFKMLFAIIKKFFSTVFLQFPASLYFKQTIFFGEKLANYLYYYLLLFSSVLFLFLLKFKSMLKRFSFPQRPSKESFILIYFVVFLVLFSASNLLVWNQFIWWRYFTPLFPFAFISVGLALDKIRFRKKIIFSVVLFFILCFWFIGNLQFYESDETSSALNKKGFSYSPVGSYLGSKVFFGEDSEKIFMEAESMDSDYHYVVFFSMADTMAAYFFYELNEFNEKTLDDSVKFSESVPEKFRFYFFESFGKFFVSSLKKQNNENVFEEIELINFVLPEEYKKDFFRGAGSASVNNKGIIGFYENLPEEFLPYFFEGVGMESFVFSGGALNLKHFEKVKGQLPGFEENFFRGVGKKIIFELSDWRFLERKDYWTQKPEKKVNVVCSFFESRNEKEKKAIIGGMKERILLIEDEKVLKELIGGIDEKHSGELFNALSKSQKSLIK